MTSSSKPSKVLKISPELHASACEVAKAKGMSLDTICSLALAEFLHPPEAGPGAKHDAAVQKALMSAVGEGIETLVQREMRTTIFLRVLGSDQCFPIGEVDGDSYSSG